MCSNKETNNSIRLLTNKKLSNLSLNIYILLEIYQRARAFMMQAGNPNQWPEGHPSKDELLEEMRQDRFYVLESEGINSFNVVLKT